MGPRPNLLKLVALTLALGAASCAKTGGPAAPSSSDAPGTTAAATTPKKGADKTASRSDAPAPPAGAQYTIWCLTVPGDGHVAQATRLRDQLVRGTGMRDWYVVHGADESTLYYGYYRSVDRQEDPKETARARTDREKIKAMVDASGARPFGNAVAVQLAGPDPDAPQQWDLRSAPPGDYWSLQIAAYADHPDRKKYAVDAVEAFRQNGVPAYYYHGETVSSVCVGSWPRQAVSGELEPAYNDPAENRSMEQIMAQTPGDLIVVAPGLPPINKEIRTKKGTMRAVSPHLEAVDPTLLATMKNYPHHYVNGVVEGMKTAQGVQGKPSLLVKIPRRPDTMLGGYGGAVAGARETRGVGGSGASALSGLPPGLGATAVSGQSASGQSARTAGDPPRRPAEQRPSTPAPGYGQLRSLEDH